MLDCDGNGGIAVKRHSSGYHLVHGDAKGIDITLIVRISAAHLLRRAVMYASHNVRTDRIGRSCLCNTKVGKFYFSVCGNDDVLRFDIAVYNIAVVCCFKTKGNLNGDAGCLFYAQFPFAVNVILQSNSLDKLHDDIVNAAVLPDIVHVYNIRMGESCCGLCLRAELADKGFILPEFRF